MTDLSSLRRVHFPIINNFFKDYVRDNIEIQDAGTYFSDAWLSRGLGGEARLAFSFDMASAIKNHSKFRAKRDCIKRSPRMHVTAN